MLGRGRVPRTSATVIRPFTTAYVAHEEAADTTTAALNDAVTVGTDGIQPRGRRDAENERVAWKYSVMYTGLGQTPTPQGAPVGQLRTATAAGWRTH